MGLSNIIEKGVKKSHFPLDEAASPPCFVSFEYPLNHGKRLGVIRLNPLSLKQLESINRIRQQLIAWKNDSRLLAVWFECEQSRAKLSLDFVKRLDNSLNNSSDKALDNPLDKQAQIHLSLKRLFDYIQHDSKFTIYWKEQAGLSQISNQIEDAHFRLCVTNQPQSNKPFTKDSVQTSSLGKLLQTDMIEVACQKHTLLERLSSYPWHCLSSKNFEISLRAFLIELPISG